MKELKENWRFAHVVNICHELGIDDPLHWWNSQSDGRVIDLWIAWHEFNKEKDAMKPATETLQKLVGDLSNGR